MGRGEGGSLDFPAPTRTIALWLAAVVNKVETRREEKNSIWRKGKGKGRKQWQCHRALTTFTGFPLRILLIKEEASLPAAEGRKRKKRKGKRGEKKCRTVAADRAHARDAFVAIQELHNSAIYTKSRGQWTDRERKHLFVKKENRKEG